MSKRARQCQGSPTPSDAPPIEEVDRGHADGDGPPPLPDDAEHEEREGKEPLDADTSRSVVAMRRCVMHTKAQNDMLRNTFENLNSTINTHMLLMQAMRSRIAELEGGSPIFTLLPSVGVGQSVEKTALSLVRNVLIPSKIGDFPHCLTTIRSKEDGEEPEDDEKIACICNRKLVTLEGRFEMAYLKDGAPANMIEKAREFVAKAEEERARRVEEAQGNYLKLSQTKVDPNPYQELEEDIAETSTVNASVFGPMGITYNIVLVNTLTGEEFTGESRPLGLDYSTPSPVFLEWPSDGSKVRDTFVVPPSEHKWTLRFYFPHLSRRKKPLHSVWMLRMEPAEEEYRAFPNLTVHTPEFRCLARYPN